MPETRRGKNEVRAEIVRLMEEHGGMTGRDYAEFAGISLVNAQSTLRRALKKGWLKESSVVRQDARGHRTRFPYYTMKAQQLRLPDPPLGTRRERRKVRAWEELTPAQQAARVASRQYYREQQARKGKVVRPRLGDDEGYTERNGTKRRGRPPSALTRLLDDSARLAQVASIVFPNGIPTNEQSLAWLEQTREVMRG